MVRDIVGVAIIVLVYACFVIIVFSPTIYAAWFYVVGRKMKLKSKGLLRTALMTFCVNLLLAYLLVHVGFDYFLPSRISEKDAIAGEAVKNAVVSQGRFHESHGRYYPVGPIRGPYRDDHGLVVEKDVILEVVPVWDKERGVETFQVYAIHVWGQSLMTGSKDGKVEKAPLDSEQALQRKAKLLNSVR
ncbi:MAG: hypothetical protein HY913_03420 [Desulfomonile tiedjei]|nr:hypothetical protein [Desulfomonile tiedjei]